MNAHQDFRSPTTLDEALSGLAEAPDGTIVIAGGTDVMIQLPRGELSGRRLMHIGRIAELEGINTAGSVRIGALTRHRDLAASAQVASVSPSIAMAAATVGGWQTQHAGSVGGNICNASPAADLAPPLLVHDARVELTSKAGIRTLSLDEFLVGRRRTARRPDELLTAFTFDPPPPRTAEVYLKVGRRSGMEVAIVGLALRLTLSDNGSSIEQARCAAASTGPRAIRFAAVEAALQGQQPSNAIFQQAADLLAEAIAPISDTRASERYRRNVAPRLFRRAASDCLRAIEGESQGA
jgi:carbon-monoxide dehydrogenase medium subunit